MLMNFPKNLQIALGYGPEHMKTFPRGLNDVPDEILEKPAIARYLELNGVKKYEPKVAEIKQFPTSQPASLEELKAEVLSRGYGDEAATQIAQDRFDGIYGDGAKYTAPGFTMEAATAEAKERAASKAAEAERVKESGAPSAADLDAVEAEKEIKLQTEPETGPIEPLEPAAPSKQTKAGNRK